MERLNPSTAVWKGGVPNGYETHFKCPSSGRYSERFSVGVGEGGAKSVSAREMLLSFAGSAFDHCSDSRCRDRRHSAL